MSIAINIPTLLAEKLRKKYYVARHANWLLVMDKFCTKIVATIYVYPEDKNVVLIDRNNIDEELKEILRSMGFTDFKVTRRVPRYQPP